MRALLCLFLEYTHATLGTGVRAFTFIRFVIHDIYSLHHFVTVDARYHDVGACCLMHVYLFPQTLCLTSGICITLHRLVLAELVMCLYLGVAEDLVASKLLVLAHELHLIQLFLYLLLDGDKPGLCAHHRALPCFFGKLVEAYLVESLVTLLALPGVH